MCYGNGNLAECYHHMGEYELSLRYVREVIRIGEQFLSDDIYWMWIYMSRGFHGLNQPDSALRYAKKAYAIISRNDFLYAKSVISPVMGDAGRGFDVCNSFAGNGMGTLRKRVEELAGNFKIHSFKNEGTALELKFKIT